MWSSNKKQKPVVPPLLSTPRLSLRPAILTDYEQWKTVRGINQKFLKPFEPTWPSDCLSADFFKRRVTRLQKDWEADRTYSFLIFEGEILIGGININNVHRGAAQYGTLGYWIDEMSQGHGFMTEAGLAVLHYAFTHLNLQRMNAATLAHNIKSRTMLTRLGFAEEGFAKNYIQIDGHRQDHVLFGLNAHEFLRPAGQT